MDLAVGFPVDGGDLVDCRKESVAAQRELQAVLAACCRQAGGSIQHIVRGAGMRADAVNAVSGLGEFEAVVAVQRSGRRHVSVPGVERPFAFPHGLIRHLKAEVGHHGLVEKQKPGRIQRMQLQR